MTVADTVSGLRAQGALAGLDLGPSGSLIRLRGHASTRIFYRVEHGASGTGILVVYPEDGATEELDRYERVARWFTAAGIRVPRVDQRGVRALLVEDGGDGLLDQADVVSRPRLYRQATRVIERLRAHTARHASPNPDLVLDGARFAMELQYLEEHALVGWLGATAGAGRRERLYADLAGLLDRLPRTVCHRDFHARNLLVRDGRLFVIDFQDAMMGPVCYDAASLLLDNYVDVSHEIIASSLARLRGSGLGTAGWPPGLAGTDREEFLLTALQRSLKALGTFGYQVAVRGQTGYAAFVPRTWRNVRRTLLQLGWDEYVEPLSYFDQVA